MRGTKAKAMRKIDSGRPNPGRKFGGSNKLQARAKAGHKRSIRKFKRLIKRQNDRQTLDHLEVEENNG